MPTQGLKAVQIGFNNSAQSRNQICSIQPEMSGYRTVIVDSWSNLQLKLPNTKKKTAATGSCTTGTWSGKSNWQWGNDIDSLTQARAACHMLISTVWRPGLWVADGPGSLWSLQ